MSFTNLTFPYPYLHSKRKVLVDYLFFHPCSMLHITYSSVVHCKGP